MQDDSHLFPRDRQPAVRLVAMPKDTNAYGHIFGGWIMSQMDIAGSVAAVEYSNSRVVTVAVTSIEFHKPVFVGDLISCFAKIEKIGKSSLTVRVEVFAQRDRDNAVHCSKVTEAVIVYVAVTSLGKPQPLPVREEDFGHYR
ncbi:MAG: acyl-CoA thioesterase [Gammaproteobacteria bacterium]|nr:acyl-CoA thioesterase [Gammaproteobacteria bacterium]MCP5423668.1 acyl-CoA thioesterase [Gammaproteobacteria bacterium]